MTARSENFLLSTEEHKEFMELYQLTEAHTIMDLIEASMAAGDSNMARIYQHVKSDGGNIWEQIDKNTGKQASATGLTWSYANILEALHYRKYTMAKLESFKRAVNA